MRDPALLNSCGTVGIFCVLYSAVFLRIIWHESAKDWRFTEKLLKRPSRYKQYIFVDFLAAAPATIVGTVRDPFSRGSHINPPPLPFLRRYS